MIFLKACLFRRKHVEFDCVFELELLIVFPFAVKYSPFSCREGDLMRKKAGGGGGGEVKLSIVTLRSPFSHSVML